MPDPTPYRVRRIAVAPEPLVPGAWSYADSFELRLADPDDHTAEQWVRAALGQAGPGVRRVIRFAHGRVARFGLSTEPGSILGWQTVSSTADALHLRTEGPLLRAEIVARRTTPTTATLTTFLFYRRRRAWLVWLLMGPVHRRIAPHLLERAASQLTRQTAA